MTIMVFSVYDRAAARFDLPFFARSRAEAYRNLAYQLSTNPDAISARYADQFALYYLGTYNDESAALAPDGQPVHLCALSELLDKDAFAALSGGDLIV